MKNSEYLPFYSQQTKAMSTPITPETLTVKPVLTPQMLHDVLEALMDPEGHDQLEVRSAYLHNINYISRARLVVYVDGILDQLNQKFTLPNLNKEYHQRFIDAVWGPALKEKAEMEEKLEAEKQRKEALKKSKIEELLKTHAQIPHFYNFACHATGGKVEAHYMSNVDGFLAGYCDRCDDIHVSTIHALRNA